MICSGGDISNLLTRSPRISRSTGDKRLGCVIHLVHPATGGRHTLPCKRRHQNAEHLFHVCWHAIQMHVLRHQLDLAL